MNEIVEQLNNSLISIKNEIPRVSSVKQASTNVNVQISVMRRYLTSLKKQNTVIKKNIPKKVQKAGGIKTGGRLENPIELDAIKAQIRSEILKEIAEKESPPVVTPVVIPVVIPPIEPHVPISIQPECLIFDNSETEDRIDQIDTQKKTVKFLEKMFKEYPLNLEPSQEQETESLPVILKEKPVIKRYKISL